MSKADKNPDQTLCQPLGLETHINPFDVLEFLHRSFSLTHHHSHPFAAASSPVSWRTGAGLCLRLRQSTRRRLMSTLSCTRRRRALMLTVLVVCYYNLVIHHPPPHTRNSTSIHDPSNTHSHIHRSPLEIETLVSHHPLHQPRLNKITSTSSLPSSTLAAGLLPSPKHSSYLISTRFSPRQGDSYGTNGDLCTTGANS